MGVMRFVIENAVSISFMVIGAFCLLMGYDVLPLEESWFTKNRRLLKICGYVQIAYALFLLAMHS